MHYPLCNLPVVRGAIGRPEAAHKRHRCCRTRNIRFPETRFDFERSKSHSQNLPPRPVCCRGERRPLRSIPSRRLQERLWCVFARKAVKHRPPPKMNPEGRQVPQRQSIRRSATIDTGSRRLRRQQYPTNRAISHTITRTTMIANANCIQIDPPMPRKTTSARSPHG